MRHSIVKCICAISATMLLLNPAYAGTVPFHTDWFACGSAPCAGSARCDYYVDDCSGKVYVIIINCDCRMEIGWFNVNSLPTWPLHLPPNFTSLFGSADFSTFGAANGLYMLDSLDNHVALYNPPSQAFVDEVWECHGDDYPGLH